MKRPKSFTTIPNALGDRKLWFRSGRRDPNHRNGGTLHYSQEILTIVQPARERINPLRVDVGLVNVNEHYYGPFTFVFDVSLAFCLRCGTITFAFTGIRIRNQILM